ncbi:MAG: MFS transporter [Candidatus Melainabacteria bacterium]|nr:MFS transporter [Candidatus Melainabacteria bacterium]
METPSSPQIDTFTKENQAHGGKATNYRWVILGLAFFITLVNYLDRSAISYAITPIRKEFGFSESEFGAVAAAFAVGYMIMTTGGGLMVDKWGARKIWAGAAILWSGVTAMMGLASSFSVLFTFRTLLGLAEGPHFPSLTRVVADWLPTNERARSTAIGLAAVPMASVIGAPLITNLIIAFGWKLMFVCLGGVGIVWAFIWYYMFRDYPENSTHVNETELRHIRDGQAVERGKSDAEMRHHHLSLGTTTWKFMLLNPSLMANNFAFFAFGYLLFFALTWLPGYYEATYHLKLKQIGFYLIAPWLTSAIMLMSAGFLSDYIWKKTGSMRKSRSHMIWICQLLSGICFIPVMYVHDVNLSLLFISLGLGFGLMPNAAFYALNTDLAKDRAATSLGLMDTFFALSGILAPYLTGLIAEKTGSFNSAFFVLIFFTLSATVAVLFFQKPDNVNTKVS